MNFTAIGTYHSEAKAPYEAGRQPMDRVKTLGEILINPGQQFEQALEDLEGFERIWLIYQFHHNPHWKPKVLPPRGSNKKVGVFATRAPYRPNPIGISCVKLVQVTGLKLIVEGADLLDGSPILDLKPYLPYADSFPDSKIGWLEGTEPYQITFTKSATEQVDFLESKGLSQLRNFILNQLEFDPTNADKKRVARVLESEFVLSYKTWRISFLLDSPTIQVQSISSGYSTAEILNEQDPYTDKALHRAFNSRFEGEK